jgi:hypothetical protein
VWLNVPVNKGCRLCVLAVLGTLVAAGRIGKVNA